MSLPSATDTIVIDTYICKEKDIQIMSDRLYERYLTKIMNI